MSTISDLTTGVNRKVENRGDSATIYLWIRDAILEIAGNTDYQDEFAELEVLGPLFVLTAGTQEYADSNFMAAAGGGGSPPADILDATLDIFIWTNPTSNTIRRRLNPTHYQAADRSSTLNQATPSEWYRFGSSIGFNPIPDQAYTTQARALRQHPFNDSAIQNTVVLLPRDWHEIVEWAAAERGYMELLEFEKAREIHVLLHGDPLHPEKPGLIYGRKKKRKREAHRVTGVLRPIRRGYSYGRNY